MRITVGTDRPCALQLSKAKSWIDSCCVATSREHRLDMSPSFPLCSLVGGRTLVPYGSSGPAIHADLRRRIIDHEIFAPGIVDVGNAERQSRCVCRQPRVGGCRCCRRSMHTCRQELYKMLPRKLCIEHGWDEDLHLHVLVISGGNGSWDLRLCSLSSWQHTYQERIRCEDIF